MSKRLEALVSFLRRLPLESSVQTGAAVVTQEPVFVRRFSVFHTEANLCVGQLRQRQTAGTVKLSIVQSGRGVRSLGLEKFLYFPNGIAITLTGSLGTVGRYGAQVLFIRLADVPWMRGLDQPDLEDLYARAPTSSSIGRFAQRSEVGAA